MTKQEIAAMQAEAHRVLDHMDKRAEQVWPKYEDAHYSEPRSRTISRYGVDAPAVPKATRTHKSE